MTDFTSSTSAEGAVMFPRPKKRIKGRSIAVLVFLTMAALFFSIPLYVLVTTSFKTMDQIRGGAIFSLPEVWTFEAWRYAWDEACSGITCEGLKRGFVNSLEILFPSLIASIAISAVTGYALALWNVRWAGGFLFLLFLCAFVPFQIIMYPLIVITVKLGIYGSVWAVAFIHTVLAMPVLTLIFRNYYKDIPPEIIKAAIMDNGSFWRIFLEIVLPMSGNILIVVLIMQITSIWNDYLIGVTFGGLGAQPMTVNLANMVTVTTGTVSYNVNMAAALQTAVPPLVIYFVLGKFFVQGIAAGAVKG
ncbi:carbohydrate ABC transporter permease [Pleomorphomonas oryzae]|uniref:carbohydrate ABC transporter permease n=1 Tax=Pleomorphomonas oryzae TaxID=261934 RepID=UPI00041C9CF8|nr:carbohydrate ABC transporter permease [Pleomorphomonas oryzae]